MTKNKRRVSEDGTPKIKASWDNYVVHIFADLCIKEIENGHRPGTHLNRDGWKNLLDNFPKETGRVYDRHQMKNKWDQLKKEWKIWKQMLQNETIVRWDPKRDTLDASDSWWEEKLKEFPDARKFRSHGIEPELEEKLDKMFVTTVDMDDFTLSHFDTDSDETPQKKRIVEQDALPEEEMQELVLGLPAVQQSPERPCRKPYSPTAQGRDGVESRSTATATSVEKAESSCTITEAIHLLDSINEIPKASLLYYFATKLILDRDKREVFMALAPDTKVWWLQMEEQESKK